MCSGVVPAALLSILPASLSSCSLFLCPVVPLSSSQTFHSHSPLKLVKTLLNVSAAASQRDSGLSLTAGWETESAGRPLLLLLFSFLPGFSFCFSGAPRFFWGTERIFKSGPESRGKPGNINLLLYLGALLPFISSSPSGRPPARHLDSVSWRTTGFSRRDATTKGPIDSCGPGVITADFDLLPNSPYFSLRTYFFISLFTRFSKIWISVFVDEPAHDENILMKFFLLHSRKYFTSSSNTNAKPPHLLSSVCFLDAEHFKIRLGSKSVYLLFYFIRVIIMLQ